MTNMTLSFKGMEPDWFCPLFHARRSASFGEDADANEFRFGLGRRLPLLCFDHADADLHVQHRRSPGDVDPDRGYQGRVCAERYADRLACGHGFHRFLSAIGCSGRTSGRSYQPQNHGCRFAVSVELDVGALWRRHWILDVAARAPWRGCRRSGRRPAIGFDHHRLFRSPRTVAGDGHIRGRSCARPGSWLRRRWPDRRGLWLAVDVRDSRIARDIARYPSVSDRSRAGAWTLFR